MVRGVVSLPHGLGKVVRVLVLCTPDKVQDAKDAGAEYAGLDEYIQKIEGGWTDVDGRSAGRRFLPLGGNSIPASFASRTRTATTARS